MRGFRNLFFLVMFFAFCGVKAKAQTNSSDYNSVNTNGRPAGPNNKTTGADSGLQKRNSLGDSITISFRNFDSIRPNRLDSNLLNLSKRVPSPYDYLTLGNLGSAARPILFTPRMTPGFDAGFHAYDVYMYTLQDTKFYQTTKPYTELGYIIGPLSEQTINLLHTQNLKPTVNVSFEYRFIAAPGTFKNQSNTHHNIRIASAFVSKNRHYSGNIVLINNKISAGENGGIIDDNLLNSSVYTDRFNIPTRLGGDAAANSNFFSSSNGITGAHYGQTFFYLRHQYDFGQKDSIITDSNVVRFFYPRFRIQHNMTISSSSYSFTDPNSNDSISKYYNYNAFTSSVVFKDEWKDFSNEFALIAFPEKENQNQYFKAGAAYQQLTGTLDNTNLQIYNLYLLGEYRNRTRNKKWDVNANGKLYLSGYNAGDYTAQIQLQANLGKRFGTVELGFQNTNQSPSFVYDTRSSFPLLGSSINNKENITHIYGNITEPKYNLVLKADYYAIANYTFWNGFYTAAQASGLVNVLRIGAEKKFKLSKHWNLYSELYLQQSTGNVINLPTIFTHQTIAYEGNFFINLFLSTGLDMRYFSPFKADNYSPLTGQFFLQDNVRLSNRPDVAAFVNFRIKSFNAFIRVENLNTFSLSPNLGFYHNNFAAPNYPTPGQFLRYGIKWRFVN